MPHLTCVGHTRAELVELLETYRDAGIENILALAGDPPGRWQRPRRRLHLRHRVGRPGPRGRGLLGLCWPPSPRSTPARWTAATDRRRLAEKLRLADFAMTTFFFDVEHYRMLLEDLADLDCDDARSSPASCRLRTWPARGECRSHERHCHPRLAVREASTPSTVTRMRPASSVSRWRPTWLRSWWSYGVPGIHLYALNRAQSIQDIYDRLGLRR